MDNLQQTSPSSPDVATVPSPELLTLTEKAVEMATAAREQEGIDPAFGLRIAVRGGGCGGFQYALDFENAARPWDRVLSQGELKIFVDQVSARYLAGVEIDYKLGIDGGGFLFKNLQTAGTCGCGSSMPA
jgi:iron-sulfur cluster assembly accessory protein